MTRTYTSGLLQGTTQSDWLPCDAHGINDVIEPMLDDDQILIAHLNNSIVTGREFSLAGGRYKSYDIQLGRELPSRFEVKRLHIRDRSVDRRFKAGGPRSQTIYGRLDSKLRRAALNIEEAYASKPMLLPMGMTQDRLREILSAIHTGRHGKKNLEAFRHLCWFFELTVDGCPEAIAARPNSQRIYEGFQDLDGIFFLIDLGQSDGRRLYYSLVPKDVIPSVVEFHSSCAEGVKLRYVGNLPAELQDERQRKRKKQENG